MTMTKRDFDFIAKQLWLYKRNREKDQTKALEYFINAFCVYAQNTNQNFKKDLFLKEVYFENTL